MELNLEGFAVEREEAAPGFFGQRFVVDLGVGGAPAVGGSVDFDFCGEFGGFEGFLQGVLVLGGSGVVVLGDGDEELRLRL